jgi:hypothetical protein
MVCDPADNNLNPPNFGPPPFIPGFGFPFVSGLPFPDVKLPDGIPEDLLALIQEILANIPGGKLLPNMTEYSKTVLDFLASILNQLGPYLALYNFLQALLNMITCIIDVLCSLMNPFSLIKALNRLFKRCLPNFLNLFPWLALIAMIIALLLLLLALIEYLINAILALIRDIIENLILLGKVIQVKGTESDIIAAARKIAMLLCMIEQLFAILIAFQAILAIIKSLAGIAGRFACSSGGGDDSGCCSDDVCPPFIRQNPDGLTGTFGYLSYHKEVQNSLTGPLVGLVLPPARTESWQFLDLQTQQFNINDIITPIDGNIFWPEGRSYEAGSNIKKVPYLADLTMFLDPTVFGIAGPSRTFFIRDTVVIKKPYIGVFDFQGNTITSPDYVLNGTVLIQGGLVFEQDKTTPVMVGGKQATLNTFIHQSPTIGIPASEDGYFINNIQYTLKINHAALMEQNIITAGCIPELESEINVVNAVIAPQLAPVIDKLNGAGLPDPAATVTCLEAALNKFRKNVSIESAAIMQAEMLACLNGLKSQTIQTYNACLESGVSQFTSTYVLNPTIQFVNKPIKVSVTLKDPTGTVITERMPQESRSHIAELITADITFGHISGFAYDGYQDFTADITSSEAGSGDITISYNGNVLSIVQGQDDDNVPTSIIPNIQNYQFVGAGSYGGIVGGAVPVPRRDESDVSSGGGG